MDAKNDDSNCMHFYCFQLNLILIELTLIWICALKFRQLYCIHNLSLLRLNPIAFSSAMQLILEYFSLSPPFFCAILFWTYQLLLVVICFCYKMTIWSLYEFYFVLAPLIFNVYFLRNFGEEGLLGKLYDEVEF